MQHVTVTCDRRGVEITEGRSVLRYAMVEFKIGEQAVPTVQFNIAKNQVNVAETRSRANRIRVYLLINSGPSVSWPGPGPT
jgi:hypothetical protein